jgi:DNA-binding MarR family transcriptional regulator
MGNRGKIEIGSVRADKLPAPLWCGAKIVWTIVVRRFNLTIMTTVHSHSFRAGRSFDSLEQEVFLNLWRTYDRLRALEEELFGRYDLTPQQYNALRLLSSEHPHKIQTLELASRLISRAPDITRLLDKLEQRGLIDRERPPDNRRIVRIGITEAGRALLRDLREPVRKCHVRQLGHLSPKERQELTALLRAARSPHEEPESQWR